MTAKMTANTTANRLPRNIEDLLNRLTENSRNELSLVRTLSEAVRRADEQVLRELRAMSLQHELRRETILDELQGLASRLCALPSRPVHAPRATIEQQPAQPAPVADDTAPPVTNGNGADWRKAAQNIQDDLDYTFGEPIPRH
jgi:hypothetical protein